MRKLLLTTAFALPLSMGAAFAQDAATTEAPATEAPAAEMTTPMASDPAPTPADTGAAEADAAAAQKEAMAAEVTASGKVAQQQAANELRLDWITDAAVTAPDGTTIGDINDLIVDGETGQMIAAIIGVGGFLGIGEKQIAVPWDQLTVNYDAAEITSGLTKEEAEAAPEYVFREQAEAPAPAAAADGAGAIPASDGSVVPADGMMDSEAPAADQPASN